MQIKSTADEFEIQPRDEHISCIYSLFLGSHGQTNTKGTEINQKVLHTLGPPQSDSFQFNPIDNSNRKHIHLEINRNGNKLQILLYVHMT